MAQTQSCCPTSKEFAATICFASLSQMTNGSKQLNLSSEQVSLSQFQAHFYYVQIDERGAIGCSL
jgi:hypothetical protein